MTRLATVVPVTTIIREQLASVMGATGWLVGKPEIELPHAQLAIAPWQPPLSIREGETQLDQLQHVHIAPACLMI